jgi:hypothetical protein
MPRRSPTRPNHRLLQTFHFCQQSPVNQFTNHIGELLRHIFVNPPYEVKAEWRPMLREEVRIRRAHFRRIMYSPAIDLAVGPFATHRQCIEEYDQMVGWSADMLYEMLQCFRRNLRKFQSRYPAPSVDQLCALNPNSRCFLAIEIERANPSMKYLMGTTFNASSFGRIGIIVAWDQRRLEDLLSAREHFYNLNSWGKNSFNTNNLLFLGRDQLARILERRAREVQRKERQ